MCDSLLNPQVLINRKASDVMGCARPNRALEAEEKWGNNYGPEINYHTSGRL
jgi:hypothetical protein